MNEHTRTYQSITIHPSGEDADLGAYEVWGDYVEEYKGRTFDTDGIIGWLYYVPNNEGKSTWVWMNEAGHPTRVLGDYDHQLMAWLYTKSPIVNWAKEARN